VIRPRIKLPNISLFPGSQNVAGGFSAPTRITRYWAPASIHDLISATSRAERT
jgi:hypothetical protein